MTRSVFRSRWSFIWRTVAFFAAFTPTSLDNMLADAMMKPETVDEVEKLLISFKVIKDETAPPPADGGGDNLTWPTAK